MRPCQNLSKLQREATPWRFCLYLVGHVMARYKCDHVAVLWTCRNSKYVDLYPAVDLWGIGRDANTYNGPYPVICHPPCGPWGKLKWNSRESRHHGINAVAFADRWGGVVEQPLGSELFKLHGTAGRVEKVNQCDFGHQAIKPTLLYWSRNV